MPEDRERSGGAVPLHERGCAGCAGGARPLAPAEVAALLRRIDGWRVVDGHHLRKEWEFGDFAAALAFANRCGAVAEEVGHHPDLLVRWGLVRAEVFTHSVDALTEDDFVLAAKLDRLRA
jgi:4a-hydroxytetrahydrobiopterin dehydratase